MSYSIVSLGRTFELRDVAGDLVCITLYRKGAQEVMDRLTALESLIAWGNGQVTQ